MIVDQHNHNLNPDISTYPHFHISTSHPPNHNNNKRVSEWASKKYGRERTVDRKENKQRTHRKYQWTIYNTRLAMFVTVRTILPTILLLLLLLLSATVVVVPVVMSEAIYTPPSLLGKPIKALIGPGNCQLLEEEWLSIPLLERIQVVSSKTSSLSSSTSTSTSTSSTSTSSSSSMSSYVLRFGPLPNKLLPLNLSTCACILAKGKILTAASATPSDTGNQDDDEKSSSRTTTTTTTDVIRPYIRIITSFMSHTTSGWDHGF